ncbi:MAG: hypothetical protein QOF33_3917 [Thermomicrobiales bacterium]|jgi:uncharacterized phosphosugar-binding protein|nr:hypothetical protein [Thermomicrobiales bacterium]
MSARAYFDAVMPRLDWLGREQLPAIEQAGVLVADAIGGGHRVWVAKTTHCLHDEVTYRAGGLMAIHALDDPIVVEAGDVVLIGTNAGTTTLTVETALTAHERGASVVVLTQMAYEADPRVIPEHPSGTRLHEHADVLIDLGGQVGDGELAMADGMRIMPGSGVATLLAAWMILAEAIDRLGKAGKTPLMWESMQLTGAMTGNLERRRAYHRTGKGFVG